MGVTLESCLFSTYSTLKRSYKYNIYRVDYLLAHVNLSPSQKFQIPLKHLLDPLRMGTGFLLQKDRPKTPTSPVNRHLEFRPMYIGTTPRHVRRGCQETGLRPALRTFGHPLLGRLRPVGRWTRGPRHEEPCVSRLLVDQKYRFEMRSRGNCRRLIHVI